MDVRSIAHSEHAAVATVPASAASTTVAQENTGVVDSLLHPLAILIRQVLTRPGRLASHLILIDDEENISQALDAGVRMHSVYHSGDGALSPPLLRHLPPGTSVHEVARRTCKKLFENDKVSRLFAIAHCPAARRLESLLKIHGDIVALEDLTISGNIGSIVRTSVAFGAGAVVLLNAQPADIYDRRLIRASRGYVFRLPVLTATTEEFIHFCRQKQLSLIVMDGESGLPVREVSALAKRLVIVFGSEKEGCSQVLRNAALLRTQIPMDSRVESLNVSTAAGIMLYSRAWFNIAQGRR